ncbi:hypothetical protein RI129_005252 [Pyrocoelia pectoralis]|uniref:Uncharacterized protein n=1 Tax=Pyrocoelia pectoralis TaxID=417401 RepID=A0AAN7VKF9_9COLE
MKLSHAGYLALRLTIAQNVPATRNHSDKLIFPTAILLASVGVAVSSFSLKQLLKSPKHR